MARRWYTRLEEQTGKQYPQMIIYCSQNLDGTTFGPKHVGKVRRIYLSGLGGWNELSLGQRSALLELFGAGPGSHEILDPVTEELVGEHVLASV